MQKRVSGLNPSYRGISKGEWGEGELIPPHDTVNVRLFGKLGSYINQSVKSLSI